MKVKLGNKTVEFRKGFKPKSLSEFTKVFALITGAKKGELKKVYTKLSGNIDSATKSTGETGE